MNQEEIEARFASVNEQLLLLRQDHDNARKGLATWLQRTAMFFAAIGGGFLFSQVLSHPKAETMSLAFTIIGIAVFSLIAALWFWACSVVVRTGRFGPIQTDWMGMRPRT
jgi:hypothetical protein